MLVGFIIFAAILGYVSVAALVYGAVESMMAKDDPLGTTAFFCGMYWPVAIFLWPLWKYVIQPAYRWGQRLGRR